MPFLVYILVSFFLAVPAWAEDMAGLSGTAGQLLQADADEARLRNERIAPVAMQMALSEDPAQRHAASLLFQEMAENQRRLAVNQEAAQANFDQMRALKQDYTGTGLTGKGSGFSLTEAEREKLTAIGVDVREAERRIALGDWNGIAHLLDEDSAEMTVEEQSRGEDYSRKTLALHRSQGVPQLASLGTISSDTITLPKITAPSVTYSEVTLRQMGIRNAIPGINILDLGHRQMQRALRNAR